MDIGWYLVAAPPLARSVGTGSLRVFDPSRVDSAAFLEVLMHLATAHFRAFGQELPRWALYDCAEMPGCVFGAAVATHELSEVHTRALHRALALEPDAAVEIVPLSLLVALPTVASGHWLIARLGCLAEASADACAAMDHALGASAGQGVNTLLERTLATWMTLVRPTRVTANCEWHAAALAAHDQFAPLWLRAAWLPAHDVPASAVFEYSAEPPATPPESVPGAYTCALDTTDHGTLRALQRVIEMRAGPQQNRRPDQPRPPPSAAPAIEPENPSLIERLELFVVAPPRTARTLDLAPFAVSVRALIDPLRSAAAGFLELLLRLDQVTFGPEGMGMPRWLYLSGVELTGAIVGLGRASERISPALRRLLRVPDEYRGLVPYAVYMAIPTVEPDVWFGHNLASIAGLLPEEQLAGLGSLTKALALKVYRARAQIGATQWASRALFVHTRMAPLHLCSAYTPAHSEARTLTYRVELDDRVLFSLARDPRGRIPDIEPTEWIADHDQPAMRDLQARIETGERLVIAGRPVRDQRGQRVPVAPWPAGE